MILILFTDELFKETKKIKLKKYLCLLSLLIVSTICKSQVIAGKNAEEMVNISISELENFLIVNGFELTKVDTSNKNSGEILRILRRQSRSFYNQYNSIKLDIKDNKETMSQDEYVSLSNKWDKFYSYNFPNSEKRVWTRNNDFEISIYSHLSHVYCDLLKVSKDYFYTTLKRYIGNPNYLESYGSTDEIMPELQFLKSYTLKSLNVEFLQGTQDDKRYYIRVVNFGEDLLKLESKP